MARPTSGALAPAEPIQFRSEQGDVLGGWWLPPRNGSSIVFAHGTGADRSQLAPQAEVLARAGYGVLLFDFPGHGESSGRVTWSRSEPSALRSAVTTAYARGSQHVAVLAFSAGAMIALHEATSDERVQALVLEGAVGTLDGSVLQDFRRWGPLSQWPAILATRWAGFRPDALGPLRPLHCQILFIAGGRDEDVPLPLTRALFSQVQAQKELWVIDNAAHGTYQQVAGPEFETRLVSFFDKALRGAAVAGTP
ncbi:MAG TPA: alpha/beta fold hydrolase [Polyangiaceae bacterium]|nr:alpha/beta fold hydrolase [Polyangiaceae bacterium]